MAIQALIDEALKLPAGERAELVARLLDSLDAQPIDAGHDAAWTEVVDRRLQEARDGKVELIAAGDAMAQARAVAASRRR